MDILKLIKERRTIRRYKDKPIPKKIIRKIVEAGRWAPSAENTQPWKFIVLRDNRAKREFIAFLRNRHYKKFLTPVNILIKASLKTIEGAPVVVLVYNTRPLLKKVKRLGKIYEGYAYMSEIQSVSAAIENMFLTATSLGIGMCWLIFPLLLKDKINNFFGVKEELVAVLTFGYPAEKGKRAGRKSVEEIVRWIK